MIFGRDQKSILKRLQNEMQKVGMDAMILTSADAVFYCTGFASRSLYRSGKIGGSLAVVTKEGEVGLICSEFEKKVALSVCDQSIKIISYPVWIYIEDYAVENMVKEPQPDLNRNFRMAAQFVPEKKDGIKIGVQYKWLTYEAGVFLKENFGSDNVIDCSKVLVEARAVKTPWEIDVLRHNAKLSEVAMYKTARAIVPGMTIADVHYIFHKECLQLAPDMTAVSQSHTIGSEFSPAWMPQEIRINQGDLIRLDGGPYTNGYKSDLGRTFAVGGTASKEKEELYAALWRGFDFAINNIGPGVKMCDIFNGTMSAINLKGFIRGHVGHSISCDISGEEAPFIAPSETRVFEPGMIMCVETPFYSSRRQTYNIEDEILITNTGIEQFTKAMPTFYL